MTNWKKAHKSIFRRQSSKWQENLRPYICKATPPWSRDRTDQQHEWSFQKIKTHFAEIVFFSLITFVKICTCPPTCIVFKETVHALFDYWIFWCIIYHENEIKCISTRNTFTCLIINLPQSSDIDGLISSFKFW